MKQMEKWMRPAAVFLVLCVLAASVSGVIGAERTPPENPLLEHRAQPFAQVTLSSSYSGMAKELPEESFSEEAETPEEPAEPEEPRKSEEPETPKTPEKLQEPEKPEELEQGTTGVAKKPDPQTQPEQTLQQPKPQQTDPSNGTPVTTPGPEISNDDPKPFPKDPEDNPEPSPKDPKDPEDDPEPSPKDPEDDPEPSPKDPEDDPKPSPQKPQIETDLQSGTYREADLPDNVLSFYVRAVGGSEGLSVLVRLMNDATDINGIKLTPWAQDEYDAPLAVGDNYIRIDLLQDGKSIDNQLFTLRLVAELADPDKPQIGPEKIILTTNLDDPAQRDQWVPDFTFLVSAVTESGKQITSDYLTVQMDGQTIASSSASAGEYGYVLNFEPPNVGQTRTYTVSVQAYDGQQSSAYLEYEIVYHHTSQGEVIGNVSVRFDATTVGYPNFLSDDYELKQGDTVADAVAGVLETNGYSYRNGGSLDVGFVLTHVVKYGEFVGLAIQPELLEVLTRDNIPTNATRSDDSLGERDFSAGSGWVYEVNGSFAGKEMSAYEPSAGASIVVRFTVAYGKDVGSGGNGGGRLQGYCQRWIDGQILDLGHQWTQSERKEPTQTEPGYILEICSRCAAVRQTDLPALGEEPQNSDMNPETESTAIRHALRSIFLQEMRDTHDEIQTMDLLLADHFACSVRPVRLW